jgi:two-component system KDP operon response regulator KdpE
VSRILVVDDEPSILAALVPLLRARGYEVFTATSGQTALDAVDRHAPQLVVLDLGLPDMEGAEVCRRVREGRAVPIIVLSARTAEADKVSALDAGADDYVTKPFGPEELLARLRAALRRAEPGTVAAGRIDRGDISIDVDQRRVTRLDEEVRLTPKEFDLLRVLAQHAGQVVTRNQLLSFVWGAGERRDSQVLRVLVGQLRQKIEADPRVPTLLLTEPGIGYRLRAEGEDE